MPRPPLYAEQPDEADLDEAYTLFAATRFDPDYIEALPPEDLKTLAVALGVFVARDAVTITAEEET